MGRLYHRFAVLFCLLLGSAVFAQSDTLRIYFFYNSMIATRGNNRYTELKAFGKARGITIYTETTPDYVGTMKTAYQTQAYLDRIRTGNWDYVILQSNPYSTESSLATYTTYGSMLIDSIRAAGAVPLIYIAQNTVEGGNVYTYEALEPIVADSCLKMARRKQCAIIPVNMAFRAIISEYPEMPLYSDWVHTTNESGYLAGMMCFLAIFGQSPFNLPMINNVQDSALARYLQVIAWESVMADSLSDLRLPWPAPPVAPTRISLLKEGDSLAQYGSRQQKVVTSFSDGTRDTSGFGVFKSINPSVVDVKYSGLMTGLVAGSAKITVRLMNFKDSAMITVTPSRAVLDSIRITPRTFAPGSVEDGTKLLATGFFHDGSFTFNQNLTSSVAWVTDTTVLKIDNGVVQRKTSKADTAMVIARLSGRSDSISFIFAPHLMFLTRINFQATSTPINEYWHADSGAYYTESAGYGWITRKSFIMRDNRHGNLLQKSFVSAGAESEYKIMSNDGDYILKIGMGDNSFGAGDTAYVLFESMSFDTSSVITRRIDTLIRHVGLSNAVSIDTIRVFGLDGIHLRVKGPINYIVAISKEGVDINDVAKDNPADLGLTQESASRSTPVPNGLLAFPNPFNPYLFVRFNAAGTSGTSRLRLTLHDCTGKTVRMLSLKESQLRKGISIDAGHLASGTYMLKVTTPEGRTSITRAILLK